MSFYPHILHAVYLRIRGKVPHNYNTTFTLRNLTFRQQYYLICSSHFNFLNVPTEVFYDLFFFFFKFQDLIQDRPLSSVVISLGSPLVSRTVPESFVVFHDMEIFEGPRPVAQFGFF